METALMYDELDEEFREGIMSELVSNDLAPDSIKKLLLSKEILFF